MVKSILREPRIVPTEFTLPELGENITAGDVLRVMVQPGDTVAKDQAVLEHETDKATIEVPSSVAGQVKEVKVKAGDKVSVGQVILSFQEAAQSAETPSAAGGAPVRTVPAQDAPVEDRSGQNPAPSAAVKPGVVAA